MDRGRGARPFLWVPVALALSVAAPQALGQGADGLAYRPPSTGLIVEMDNGFVFEVTGNEGRRTILAFRSRNNPKRVQKYTMDRVLTTMRSEPTAGVTYRYAYEANPASSLWPLRVGKTVSTAYSISKGQTLVARGRETYTVARREPITVLGKEHQSYVVVRTVQLQAPNGRGQRYRVTIWYSPALRFFVRRRHSGWENGRFHVLRDFRAVKVTRP
jgi:hypothetical protein